MKVLAPITVTEAMLVSSTLPETEHPAWSSGSTYALAGRVIKAHKVWQSAQASNTNHEPTTDDGTWWTLVGPSNTWAMFDEKTSTVSASATSSMEVALSTGVWVTDLALVAFAGTSARVRVYESDGTTLLYDQTKVLPGIASPSFYDWFFSRALVASGSIVFTGLPRRVAGKIKVTMNGPGSVSLGVLALGVTHDIGSTQDDPTSDLVDYSRVDWDEFGDVTITRRKRLKRVTYPVYLPNADVPRVLALREALSSVMCVFIGTDEIENLQDALLAYGLFTKFPLAIRGRTHSTYTVEVQSA